MNTSGNWQRRQGNNGTSTLGTRSNMPSDPARMRLDRRGALSISSYSKVEEMRVNPSLEEMEKNYILHVLKEAGNNQLSYWFG
jgi:hypothetical protein